MQFKLLQVVLIFALEITRFLNLKNEARRRKMNKTTTFAVILTLAVVLGFALVSVPPAEADDQIKGTPVWQIFKEGTNKPVKWIPANNPRFCIYDNETPEDETDDAVLDKETRLIWQRSPLDIHFMWNEANQYCLQLELANRRGFRMPTVEELGSLLDENGGSPTSPALLPADHPFIDVQPYPYHSSTSAYSPWDVDSRYIDYAWLMHFGLGHITRYHKMGAFVFGVCEAE